MAQQFLADGQDLAAPVVIVTTAETTGPITNFVPTPYQTSKFRVLAVLLIQLAAGSATITVRLRRNPSLENLIINTVQAVTVVASTTIQITIAAVDPIPDGRSVQYAATVAIAGAGANGSFLAGSHIECVGMSG